MINLHGILDLNGPYRLIYLNTCSQLVELLKEGLGGMASLEEVCHGVSFKVSKAPNSPTSLLFLPRCHCLNMLCLNYCSRAMLVMMAQHNRKSKKITCFGYFDNCFYVTYILHLCFSIVSKSPNFFLFISLFFSTTLFFFWDKTVYEAIQLRLAINCICFPRGSGITGVSLYPAPILSLLTFHISFKFFCWFYQVF